MQSKQIRLFIGFGLTMVLNACAAVEPNPAAGGKEYAGWYMANGVFQPCGSSEQWRIGNPTGIRARAEASGLSTDNPFYVRVTGERTSAGLQVSRVDQVGSPDPVRDCPLTGVVTRSPGG